jgi:Flp pilus assembly protein TadG
VTRSKPLADRSGAAAVELALVLPLFVMFVFGIWQLGWGLFNGGEVRHAVELGSRIYITNPNASASDLATAVASHMNDLPMSAITLAVTPQTVGTASIEHITWSYQYVVSIPFMTMPPMSFSGAVDVPLETAT